MENNIEYLEVGKTLRDKLELLETNSPKIERVLKQLYLKRNHKPEQILVLKGSCVEEVFKKNYEDFGIFLEEDKVTTYFRSSIFKYKILEGDEEPEKNKLNLRIEGLKIKEVPYIVNRGYFFPQNNIITVDDLKKEARDLIKVNNDIIRARNLDDERKYILSLTLYLAGIKKDFTLKFDNSPTRENYRATLDDIFLNKSKNFNSCLERMLLGKKVIPKYFKNTLDSDYVFSIKDIIRRERIFSAINVETLEKPEWKFPVEGLKDFKVKNIYAYLIENEENHIKKILSLLQKDSRNESLLYLENLLLFEKDGEIYLAYNKTITDYIVKVIDPYRDRTVSLLKYKNLNNLRVFTRRDARKYNLDYKDVLYSPKVVDYLMKIYISALNGTSSHPLIEELRVDKHQSNEIIKVLERNVPIYKLRDMFSVYGNIEGDKIVIPKEVFRGD